LLGELCLVGLVAFVLRAPPDGRPLPRRQLDLDDLLLLELQVRVCKLTRTLRIRVLLQLPQLARTSSVGTVPLPVGLGLLLHV